MRFTGFQVKGLGPAAFLNLGLPSVPSVSDVRVLGKNCNCPEEIPTLYVVSENAIPR